jgi:hypothetical protein
MPKITVIFGLWIFIHGENLFQQIERKEMKSSHLKTVFKMPFFVFLIVVFVLCERWVSAQNQLDRLFPEVFDSPNPDVLVNWETGRKLGMNLEEFTQLSSKLFDEYTASMETLMGDSNRNKLSREQVIEEMSQIRRSVVASFTSELTEAQYQNVQQILVSSYLQNVFRPESIDLPHAMSKQLPLFLLNKGVVEMIEMAPKQKLAIEDELLNFKHKMNELVQEHSERKKVLFASWQQELYEELLPFQKQTFDHATGDPWSLDEEFLNVYKREADDLFLKSSEELDKSRLLISDPSELTMLLATPFYIDAPLNPHGLFALLLSREIVEELSLTDRQTTRLKMLKSQFNASESMPETLRVRLTFGSDMGPQQQRIASRKAQKEYEKTHAMIDDILDSQQSNRLRQIGNQFLLSTGWKEVPLMFPDWESYLELSRQQVIKFGQIKDKHIDQLRELLIEFEQSQRELVKSCNSEISKSITDKQKNKLLVLLNIELLIN